MTESARDVIAEALGDCFEPLLFADEILDALRSAGYDPEARYEQVGWTLRDEGEYPEWLLYSRDAFEADDDQAMPQLPQPVFRKVDP